MAGVKADKREVEIDQYNLEEEWVAHPSLYAKYALMAANARRDHDESKAQLDLVDAELDKDIRSDPDKYGLGKTTEKSIESVLLTDKQHKDAVQEVIDARHHMDVCNGIVTALEHRKVALSKLVDLQLSDQFSKPKASVDNKEKMEEVERKSVRRKGRRERDTDD